MLGFRKKKSPDSPETPAKTGMFARLRDGLSRTRHSLTDGVADLVQGSKAIDADLLEEIETTLLVADVGVEATREIIDYLTDQIAFNNLKDADALMTALHGRMQAILATASRPLVLPDDTRPFVILMVGINGAGKTTTIGKLTNRLQQQGHKVMLAATRIVPSTSSLSLTKHTSTWTIPT